MNDKVKTFLFDILSSIHEIDSFFADAPQTIEAFKTILKPAGQMKGI